MGYCTIVISSKYFLDDNFFVVDIVYKITFVLLQDRHKYAYGSSLTVDSPFFII